MSLAACRRLVLAGSLAGVLALAGCGDEGGGESGEGEQGSSAQQDDGQQGDNQGDQEGSSDQKYPDILEVKVEKEDDTTASLSVTVSSPYDTPERYADG